MVFTPDSPPISPKTVKHGKRSRHSSKGELSFEELSADDVGYDADIEVVRPDQIEEPESDFEEDAGSLGIKHLLWPDTDEELAGKMKKLSWHSKRPRAKSFQGHADRPTTPIQEDATRVNKHGKRTEFEVEMMDGHNSAPPAKRRKRKDSGLNMAQRLMGNNRWKGATDTSDRTDDRQTSILESSEATALSDARGPPVDSNEMDLD